MPMVPIAVSMPMPVSMSAVPMTVAMASVTMAAMTSMTITAVTVVAMTMTAGGHDLHVRGLRVYDQRMRQVPLS